jgi:peptidoglycan/LPS O-acetylase OafA/YrhL
MATASARVPPLELSLKEGVMISRRFASIDALRGLAALGVVFSHISQHQSFVQTPATPFWLGAALDQACSYGRVGVTLFFVISGFCIHLRWASIRREGRDAHIDFASFWKKRFRRLYPPFFVALVFYVGVQTWDGTIRWSSFDAYDLVSHLLMVHNFDERTIFSFNGVFWTLAIEEQLYCAYFLLLYMRSRWGWGPTLFVCISGRLAWFALAFAVNNLGYKFRLPHDAGSLAHWFVWALGAISIEAAFGLIKLPAWSLKSKYAVITFAFAAFCQHVSEFHLFGEVGWQLARLAAAPVWGVGCFVVVNKLVAAESQWCANRAAPRYVTFFAALGLFSYSTYLMHSFVLRYVDPAFRGTLGITNSLPVRFLTLVLCVGFSWVFFVCIERPFIAKPVARKSDSPGTTKSSILSPAVS